MHGQRACGRGSGGYTVRQSNYDKLRRVGEEGGGGVRLSFLGMCSVFSTFAFKLPSLTDLRFFLVGFLFLAAIYDHIICTKYILIPGISLRMRNQDGHWVYC